MDGRFDADLERRVAARVAAVAGAMEESMPELGRTLYEELAESIPELRGDPIILDLLRASTESNVETFLHVARYDIAIDDVRSPSAAVEYARRLAQRGTSSNALLRAYRLGQRRVYDWGLAEIEQHETDRKVALGAAKLLHEATFAYVDKVAEHVVHEYERERERWLANRNTVRATTLSGLLEGTITDAGGAEQALGYRLRQNHLGVVLWTLEEGPGAHELRRVEHLLGAIADLLGAEGHPFFMPQDRALAWGWIPLGRTVQRIDHGPIEHLVAEQDIDLRVAMGTPGAAVPGFRTTHLEALRAHSVAMAAGDRAMRATAYGDPGVRAAALLVRDLPMTRELVLSTLGDLAIDDEGAERLRDTLLTFLAEKGSFRSTGERLHLHRNTVKYRVDKAIETRGRAIDDDRLNLELALLACRWLGCSVLA